MQLVSIELFGFKSFPEKTKIHFHKGMTAIVGPNGSGKSNITDAIRWVLGEQSAKSLRGKKMEDVIFVGTETRRKMSFAEVSLNFDNNSLLHLDYDEVKITRRLYRSGDSEYKINGHTCRLKDIQELFLDTGLGKDGYSIIGQGRVDELLSSKSEDRRLVFEEASGISKYRVKKEEALRKLVKTDENLARVDDVLQEINKNRPKLKEQAAKAEKYLVLSEDLKGLEIAVMLDKIKTAEKKFKEQEKSLESYSDDAAKLSLLYKEADEALLVLKKIMAEDEEETKNILASKAKRAEKIAMHLAEKEVLENREEIITKTVADLKSKHNEEANNHQELIDEINDKKAAREKEFLATQKIIGAEALVEQKIAELSDKMGLATQVYEEKNKELEQNQENYFKAKTLAAESSSLFKNLQEQLNKINENKDEQLEGLKELESSYDLTKTEAIQAVEKREMALKHLEEFKKQKDELSKQANDFLVQKAEAERHFHRLSDEIHNQEAWADSYEAYPVSIKALMAKKISFDKTRGIIGSVADLIRCEEKYEKAIDTALASLTQNLVVHNTEDAKFFIKTLKNEKLGRASFLPISDLNIRVCESELLYKLEKQRGFIALASELVDIVSMPNKSSLNDYEKNRLKEFLLARTAIVENLDYASEIAQNIKHKIRIVTLEGDILQTTGIITGGSYRNEKTSLISRHNLIAKLKNEGLKLKEKIDFHNKQINSLQVKIYELEADEKIKQEELKEIEAFCIEKQIKQNSLWQELLVKKENFAMQNKNIAELESSCERARNEAMLQLKEANGFNKKIDEGKKELEFLFADSKSKSAELDKLREEKNELKICLNSAKERLLQFDYWLERLNKELNQKNHENSRRENSLQEAENEIKELGILKQEWAAKDEQIKLEYDLEEAKYAELENKISETKLKYKSLEDEHKSLFLNLQELEKNKARYEERISQMQDQKNELRLELWDQYNLTFDNCMAELELVEKNEYKGQPKPWHDNYKRLDLSVDVKKMNALKEDIKELGQVNLGAIEAFSLLEERNNFLNQQREDIVAAKNELNSLIAKLKQDMKNIFLTSLEAINQEFCHTFKALFGGGMARIELEDKHNVLESNIEIKVSPPGKKLQNMLLLSGGEKALSAIALLFAILKQNPALFVILDEIEAALDEANVYRFANYVKKHIDNSQFILVTHRKATMEACDRIYGVTMQEKGVSSILSMELN